MSTVKMNQSTYWGINTIWDDIVVIQKQDSSWISFVHFHEQLRSEWIISYLLFIPVKVKILIIHIPMNKPMEESKGMRDVPESVGWSDS